MRRQYITVLILLVGLNANAQSEQYKRSKKTITPEVSSPSAPSSANNKGKDLKVDIKNLEEQYWTPQDTEFKVVQNRKFSKDGRFAFTLQTIPISDDSYTDDNFSLSGTLGYYFSEFMGVELNYTKFNVDKSEIIDRFGSQYSGISPDYSIADSYIGANFNWIPIYGKMSILDNRIIYFDLAISPGIGMLKYSPQTKNEAPFLNVSDKNTFVLALDISQHFFFSEHWAFRIDMKNRRYKEERYGFSGTTKGELVGEPNRTVTSWQLGFTYYFGASKTPAAQQGGQ